MPVYKNEDKGTWYCSFYYTDWQGNRKKKKKEGFKLQRDAKEYEKEFIRTHSGTSCDMLFKDIAKLYLEDKKIKLKIMKISILFIKIRVILYTYIILKIKLY